MISIVTGLPGAGKSFYTARKSVDLLKNNVRWFQKSGIRRKVLTNLKLNPEVESHFGYGTEHSFLDYWEDPIELPGLRDCDVVWEEMGATCDSRQWENMPLELRRWLAQHRHRGVEIYGNVQEFMDIDIAVRRLTQELLYLTKIIGSRDPSPTKPPVKRVWGFVMIQKLDPRDYKEESKISRAGWSFPSFMWLDRETVELYDMFNDIRPGKYPPLQHRERLCDTCGYKKTIHV